MKEYTILLKKSGGQWVSLCLETMVAGCGETKDKAITSLKDAMECYISSMDCEGLPSDRPVPLDVMKQFLAGEGKCQSNTDDTDCAEVRVITYGKA